MLQHVVSPLCQAPDVAKRGLKVTSPWAFTGRLDPRPHPAGVFFYCHFPPKTRDADGMPSMGQQVLCRQEMLFGPPDIFFTNTLFYYLQHAWLHDSHSEQHRGRTPHIMQSRHAKAKAWRLRLGLTSDQLEKLTGYTAITIYWFERGETPPKRNAKGGNENDRRIKDWVWCRWQRACGDVDAEINGRQPGEKFKW